MAFLALGGDGLFGSGGLSVLGFFLSASSSKGSARFDLEVAKLTDDSRLNSGFCPDFTFQQTASRKCSTFCFHPDNGGRETCLCLSVFLCLCHDPSFLCSAVRLLAFQPAAKASCKIPLIHVFHLFFFIYILIFYRVTTAFIFIAAILPTILGILFFLIEGILFGLQLQVFTFNRIIFIPALIIFITNVSVSARPVWASAVGLLDPS